MTLKRICESQDFDPTHTEYGVVLQRSDLLVSQGRTKELSGGGSAKTCEPTKMLQTEHHIEACSSCGQHLRV